MKNKIELRQFTDSDWDCYSGCESDNPMIAEGPLWTLVVDGHRVEFNLDDGLNEGPSWNLEFPTTAVALRAAYAILASPTRGVVTALLDHWAEGLPDDGADF